ncbi:MAG: segregation/condensation protein A [Actinobacteria bacterium]|nr:segregation/condensation protein A [Actinomycetota bacterium]
MSYPVHTSTYEGPFDLLLHLILKEEVDLYEVNLSSIVDAYLIELDAMAESEDGINLELATEFLLIAATLIELKTRRLLPNVDDADLDEELALWEERDLLLARLLECKTFKNAAAMMQAIADDASRSYARTAGPDDRYHELAPDSLANVVPDDVRRAFLAAVAPKPVARVDIDHIAAIVMSVTDAVRELTFELPAMGKVTFRNLTGDLVARLDVVIRFLAVLELFKGGLIELDQIGNFGDIVIEWTGEADNRDLELDVDVYAG